LGLASAVDRRAAAAHGQDDPDAEHARGVHANYPDVQLVLLLVDERPEEVTDMRRNVPGTVFASSNDNTIEKHLDLATLVIERCKRQVEFGGEHRRADGFAHARGARF